MASTRHLEHRAPHAAPDRQIVMRGTTLRGPGLALAAACALAVACVDRPTRPGAAALAESQRPGGPAAARPPSAPPDLGGPAVERPPRPETRRPRRDPYAIDRLLQSPEFYAQLTRRPAPRVAPEGAPLRPVRRTAPVPGTFSVIAPNPAPPAPPAEPAQQAVVESGGVRLLVRVEALGGAPGGAAPSGGGVIAGGGVTAGGAATAGPAPTPTIEAVVLTGYSLARPGDVGAMGLSGALVGGDSVNGAIGISGALRFPSSRLGIPGIGAQDADDGGGEAAFGGSATFTLAQPGGPVTPRLPGQGATGGGLVGGSFAPGGPGNSGGFLPGLGQSGGITSLGAGTGAALGGLGAGQTLPGGLVSPTGTLTGTAPSTATPGPGLGAGGSGGGTGPGGTGAGGLVTAPAGTTSGGTSSVTAPASGSTPSSAVLPATP